MNNELNVFNSFCRVGLLYGRVFSPKDAQAIAGDLNQTYQNFGLHLTWREVLNKNYQELYVYLDSLLAKRYSFITNLFYFPHWRLN